MSSEKNGIVGGFSRCLFCSLQCAFGFTEAGPDYYVPTFPQEDGAGLCARGMMVGDCISVTRRGTVQDSRTGSEEISLSEGLRRAREALSACRGVDIIVDGNHKAEVMAAAMAFAQASSEAVRSLVALPGEDVLVLQNVWASGASFGGLDSIEEADGLLVVGDPFLSHPRSARQILRFKRMNPRAPLVVIDSVGGRTSRFATHCSIVDPSRFVEAVARLAPRGEEPIPGLLSDGGDPIGGLEDCLAALTSCENLAVILASSPGRGKEWPLIGYVCGRIAKAYGTKLVILTQYGNAAAATRFISEGKLLPCGDLLEQSPGERAIILIGEELLCLPPENSIVSYVKQAPIVVQVSVFPARELPVVHFPGAFYAEEEGHVVNQQGEWELVPAAIERPSGVVPTVELLEQLLRLEAQETVFPALQALPGQPELKAPDLVLSEPKLGGKGSMRAILMADPKHFVAGVFTADASYLSSARGATRVLMAPADCSSLGVADGGDVILSSLSNECRATVEVSTTQPPGVVAVAAFDPSARKLFPWELVDGLPIASPTRIDVTGARNS